MTGFIITCSMRVSDILTKLPTHECDGWIFYTPLNGSEGMPAKMAPLMGYTLIRLRCKLPEAFAFEDNEARMLLATTFIESTLGEHALQKRGTHPGHVSI